MPTTGVWQRPDCKSKSWLGRPRRELDIDSADITRNDADDNVVSRSNPSVLRTERSTAPTESEAAEHWLGPPGAADDGHSKMHYYGWKSGTVRDASAVFAGLQRRRTARFYRIRLRNTGYYQDRHNAHAADLYFSAYRMPNRPIEPPRGWASWFDGTKIHSDFGPW